MNKKLLPTWLVNLVKERARDKLPLWELLLENGWPTAKQEKFKYIDFSFLYNELFFSPHQKTVDYKSSIEALRLNKDHVLIVLVDGFFMPTLSDFKNMPSEVVLEERMHEACAATKNQFLESAHPFYLLNQVMMDSVLYLTVPSDTTLTIQLLSLTTEANHIEQPRHAIYLSENSDLTLFATYHHLTQEKTFNNVVMTIHCEKNSKLHFVKFQNENKHAIHFATTLINQAKESEVSFVNLTKGSSFSRDDVIINLNEEKAKCYTSGFYHLNTDKQFSDHHISINHYGNFTKSDMLYKGIIDKKSTAVFNGCVHVASNVNGIEALQMNHHLLLSPHAEAYAKPELEIYADDVKCKHGATCGEIDDDALFYLRSRGISKENAMRVLTEAFSEAVLHRIKDKSVLHYLREQLSC